MIPAGAAATLPRRPQPSAPMAKAQTKTTDAASVDTARTDAALGAPVTTPPEGKLSETVALPAPDVTAEPPALDVALDTDAFAATAVEVTTLAEARTGDIVPDESADTAVSPVLRAASLASTVGPGVDILLTTRLDVPVTAETAGAAGTASGDMVEVFTGSATFAGMRGGVAFADGRGLATAEQAERLVREFGYRCPALSA